MPGIGKLGGDQRKLVSLGIAVAAFLGFLLLLAYKQRMALHIAAVPNDTGDFTRAATLASLLVIVPLILLLPAGRWRIGGALCLDLLITLLLYADVLYSRQFGDLASAFSLSFAGQLVDVRTSVESLARPADWKLWADLPVLLLVLLAWGPVARRFGKALGGFAPWRARLYVVLVLVLTGIAIDAYCIARDAIPAANPHWNNVENAVVAGQLGFLNYHAMDVYRCTIQRWRMRTVNAADLKRTEEWFQQHDQPAAASKTGLQGAARGKNLIVLQVEALQAFAIGLKIGGQEVTPNLNRLATQSLLFTHMYSQVSAGMTSDADMLANCSLYPLHNSVVYYNYQDDDFRCMPQLARRNGYRAIALQGIAPAFWNLANVYPRIGFEDYYNLNNGLKLDERIGLGLSDESFLRQAMKYLEKTPQPFYAFLVTLSSHMPFTQAGLPHTLRLGPFAGTWVGNYLDAEHYTDSAIGQFVERLRRTGLLDRSVLVIYGDHFGVTRENTGVTTLLKMLQTGGPNELAYTNLKLRTPLLVRIPGTGGKRMAQWGGEIDIAPTLAGILGFSTKGFHFMGRDLLAHPDGLVSLRDGSVFGQRHYWLQSERALHGQCFEQAGETAVSNRNCSNIVSQAELARRISRFIVEENLMPRLDTTARVSPGGL